MKICAFHRQRVRIERRFPVGAKRSRAMRHLASEAGAALVVVGGHAVGWRLPDGSMACAKRRYPNEAAAHSDMTRIAATSSARRIPLRVYLCEFCGGWHTTHQGSKRAFMHSKDGSGGSQRT